MMFLFVARKPRRAFALEINVNKSLASMLARPSLLMTARCCSFPTIAYLDECLLFAMTAA